MIYIYRTPDGQHASFQQMPWSDSAVIALDNTDCTVREIRLNRRLTAQLFEKMYLTAPDNPRSMNPEALSKLANKYCAACTPVSDPTEACRMAINDIKQNGGTLVTCGSFYLAGEVRGYLLENKNI